MGSDLSYYPRSWLYPLKRSVDMGSEKLPVDVNEAKKAHANAQLDVGPVNTPGKRARGDSDSDNENSTQYPAFSSSLRRLVPSLTSSNNSSSTDLKAKDAQKKGTDVNDTLDRQEPAKTEDTNDSGNQAKGERRWWTLWTVQSRPPSTTVQEESEEQKVNETKNVAGKQNEKEAASESTESAQSTNDTAMANSYRWSIFRRSSTNLQANATSKDDTDQKGSEETNGKQDKNGTKETSNNNDKNARKPSKGQLNEQTSESSQDGGDDTSRPPSPNRSWAFWARNNSTGELAVEGTPSENHPTRTKERNDEDEQPKSEDQKAKKEKEKEKEKEKAKKKDDQKEKENVKEKDKDLKEEQQEGFQNGKDQKEKEKKAKDKKVKLSRPNIVAPDTDQCFPVLSLRESVKRLFSSGSSRDPSIVQQFDPVLRAPPRRVYKVVVVGVHGFFPTKMIRSILGEPTGTSLKFANEAAHAVQRWANEKNMMVEIERISLEGEGKVMSRVEKLYKLLLNWIEHIQQADFVFFAAHSQGTPVAVHILARLVEEGHVEEKQLALLGMAGISLGPISGLDKRLVMKAYSSIESASLSELFEFQNVNSFQSRKYLDSLRTIVAHNTKIVFVGSMNDQLVPLYSSTCVHVSHPNIFRAVYVDGQDVPPEFISTLVALALRLRNIGASDHNVLKELSSALPGTLTGGGHSKIYNEPRVYDLVLKYALETTDARLGVPLKVDSEFTVPKVNSNPYILPWCMRGMLAEAVARRAAFNEHLEELYNEYEGWKPETKVLKDVKYRLSAIHAKL
uniref:ARAD1A05830p n=1 Tax=Blastobotrys adeninivorans TaxID=409370 RepID=A0A060T273_BLAAD